MWLSTGMCEGGDDCNTNIITGSVSTWDEDGCLVWVEFDWRVWPTGSSQVMSEHPCEVWHMTLCVRGARLPCCGTSVEHVVL